MGSDNRQVYISYAWGGESERIVNELDADLQTRGSITVVRDKRDLGFKGMIRDFMKEIGLGHAVIIVISDKYLKSPNCMFELVEIAKNKDFYDRVFPIVLGDADIYNPVNRIKYIKHWEDKLKELDEAMRSVSSANLQGMRDEIDSYDEIRDNISNLTFLLKDMNTLTPEMHEGSNFSALISELKKRLGDEAGAGDEPAPKPAPKAAPKEPAAKKPKASKPSEPAEPGSTSAYLEKITKKLSRDNYDELPDERFGDLRFDRVLEKVDKKKVLMIPTEEYHRFAILTEEDLSDDRYIELEKEFKEYCMDAYKRVNQYVYTLGLILTNKVSDELKELIYETTPAKYTFGILAITAIAVYSAEENEIYYPKTITEDYNSDYKGKLQKYLKP